MVSRRVINVTGGVLAEEIVQEFGSSLRGN